MTGATSRDGRLASLASIEPRGGLWDIDGWQRFVETRSKTWRVEMMSRAEYELLGRADRALFDVQRRMALANLPKFDTPMAAPVREQIAATIVKNTFDMDVGPREGVFLSANPGLGKSTLMRHVAADFDEEVRNLATVMPSRFGYLDRWVPVVWISVPSKVTIISLCRRILFFFGCEMPKGARQAELEERVLILIRACGVELLVLDDITRLNLNRDRDKEVADWIRHLMETSVTILGIGVDIPTSGLAMMTDRAPGESRAALKQNRTRFSLHTLGRFTYDSDKQVNDWVSHLMDLEAVLPLLEGTDGALSDDALAELLYARSGGVIGTLHNLVGKACLTVIGREVKRGGEVITADDIKRVVLDIEAEEGYRAALATPAPTKSRRATGSKKNTNSAYDGAQRRTA